MGCDGFAVLKGFELAVCIVCIILKRVTDDLAFSVFYLRQKLSKEWPFLNNVTWEENGSSFADITYGGFVIITAGLLIGYVMRELRSSRKMETFFLLLGFILFAIIGGLVLASIESVPPDLINNAAALGAMSLVGALLFLLDLLLWPKRPGKIRYIPKIDAINQTDPASTMVDLIPIEVENKLTQTNGFVRNYTTEDKNHTGVMGELRSSLKNSKMTTYNDKGGTPDLMKGQKGYYGGQNISERDGIVNEGYQNGYRDNNGHLESQVFEKMGDRQKSSGRYPEDQKYMEQCEIPVSHNLDKFQKKYTKRTGTGYSSGESDFDDFIHLPTVSFLLAERGEERRKKTLGSRTPTERIGGRGTQMLPMMPLMKSDNSEFRRTRSIENMVRKEDLDRERREIENEREELARERERYLFDSRKHKEMLASREYDRKTQSVTPDYPESGYYRTPALTPDFNAQRKKSVTIKDPDVDEVQEKLSQQGFKKVDSEPTRRKFVGFSQDLPESGDQKRHMEHFRFDSRDANSVRQSPESRSTPSTPMDPGFVLHTATNWPETNPKTLSQSPGEKGHYRASSDDEYRPMFDPPLGEAPIIPMSQRAGKASHFKLETPRKEDMDDAPSGGSIRTQLFQKWSRQQNAKVVRVNP